MNYSRILLLLAAPVLAFGQLVAQQPSPPAFRSPLLPRVPVGQEWTATTFQGGPESVEEILTGGKVKAIGGDLPRSCKMTKNGDVYKILDSGIPGKETWVWKNMNLDREEGKPLFRYATMTDDSGGSFGWDFSRSDFPDLHWLKAVYFTGTATFLNKSAFVFERSGDNGQSEKVWLDGATQLPLLKQKGNTVTLYEYSAAPVPEIPADVRMSFEEWLRSLTFLNKN